MKLMAMVAAASILTVVPVKAFARAEVRSAPNPSAVLQPVPRPTAPPPSIKIDPADPLGDPELLVLPNLPHLPAPAPRPAKVANHINLRAA